MNLPKRTTFGILALTIIAFAGLANIYAQTAVDALMRTEAMQSLNNGVSSATTSVVTQQALRPDLVGSQANPENRSLWGALAVDSSQGQKWGWAIDYPTVQEARQRALSECGRNCRVVMTFRNQCAAYAADQERGSTIYGWAKNSTSASAQSRALNECRNRGGKSCIVRVWG